MSDLYHTVTKIVEKQFKEVVKDGERKMKSLAPHPTGASRGKGSMSTGKTKDSIHTEWHGIQEAVIKPTTEWANFAENGRGSISKPYLMKFIGADKRYHAAYVVRPMEGWHFAEKTAEYLRSKYGK